MAETLMTVKNLNIAYDGKSILENINFSVEDGDFLVIFGENGSGKSSLMKTILGLHAQSSGEISFGGGMKRHDIGYLPQASPVQRDFPASVGEVVLSGCLNKLGWRTFYGKKEKQLAENNMKLLGIYEKRGECFRNLSGGQRQRALLARALCAARKMILLDEPIAGLDPSAAADFYETICRINKSGITVIMVSHDVHTSLSVAKHVLKIGKREAAFFGTPQEYELSGEETI